MSAVRNLASLQRIKASHRRRWKGAAGRFVQRYYDPVIGRFLSVDPVVANPETGASFNRYNYANNNPYRFTDPDGRDGGNFYTHPEFQMATPRITGMDVGTALVAVMCTCDPTYVAPAGSGALQPVTTPIETVALGAAGKVGSVGEAAAGVEVAETATGPTLRADIQLSGGRSGSAVKDLTAPPNSAVRGANGRAFVTNEKGQVVKDITKERVKPVEPGKGFGEKRAPTPEEVKLVHDLHRK